MAHQLFRAKVHIGYLAAIVAASNAGGAWSVVGDTTTTMMWIDGVSPLAVFEAIIAASVALFIFGIPAAILQQKYSPILQHSHEHTRIDWVRVGIVGLILRSRHRHQRDDQYEIPRFSPLIFPLSAPRCGWRS